MSAGTNGAAAMVPLAAIACCTSEAEGLDIWKRRAISSRECALMELLSDPAFNSWAGCICHIYVLLCVRNQKDTA